jgi:sugar O-acyltransferase (sialic acid O-acetyltransferase NeuD family)
MNRKQKVILVGGFSEIVELCELSKIEIIGIIDNELSGKYQDYKIIGTDQEAPSIFHKFRDVPVVISPDNPAKRLHLSRLYQKIGFRFCNLIHPEASISKSAQLGLGLIIQNMVNVSSNVIIDDFVKINVGANVMHDCVIGSFTTIAPNAVLLGRVRIGRNCYIGAQATVLPDLAVRNGAVVGAAAVVTKNVNQKAIVKGNPAR